MFPPLYIKLGETDLSSEMFQDTLSIRINITSGFNAEELEQSSTLLSIIQYFNKVLANEVRIFIVCNSTFFLLS